MEDRLLLRYSRHLLLDEIGIGGQQRLTAGRALIVGAGGLGSAAALYLAAAGVGNISIGDQDRVDLTNLQRQIAHDMTSLGENKALSASRRMAAMNPEIRVTPLPMRLEGDVLLEHVAAADVVLDCSDNFATRQAVNRACVRHGKPLVSGAAVRFDGQLSVFDLRQEDAPCYACLFPENAADAEMRCAEFGVFAPLVGVVGAIQASEALKLLMHIGNSLSGRLLLFSALDAEWRSIRLRKDAACLVCRSESRNVPGRQ
jgi:adenylyltransferase/sulfurtransferase